MVTELKTQADLEEILNDKDKYEEHLTGRVRELLGDSVKESMSQAIKRLPMDLSVTKEDRKALSAGGIGRAMAGVAQREAVKLNGQFESFGDFLTAIHPRTIQREGYDPRLKVLGEGQLDQGGALVPDEFAANLLSLVLEQSVIRPRAFVIPMAGLVLSLPTIRDTTHASTVHGGVQAYWVPESGAVTASEPSFGRATWTAKKLIGYTTAGNELLADSAIALEAIINRVIPEGMSFFEDDAFLNGSGAGQPIGVLNADALVTQAKESGQAATTLVKANLDKMYSRMLPSSVSRAVWLAHPDTIPQLFALSQSVGTGGSPVMVMNIANSPTFTIYGRPVIITEKCQTLGTAGDIFFVDLSYYVIADRQSIEMAASPHVRFTNDETVFRFTQRLDGKPWIDSALTPRNGTTTLSPFVNLATRS